MPKSSRPWIKMRVAVALAVVASSSCVSLGRSSFEGRRGPCLSRREITGEWRSRRNSQLGAATVTLKMDCDCRYRMVIATRIGRITEEGEYRTHQDQLVFSRGKGDTSWPFRIAGETLVLIEGETDVYEYQRISRSSCATYAPRSDSVSDARGA